MGGPPWAFLPDWPAATHGGPFSLYQVRAFASARAKPCPDWHQARRPDAMAGDDGQSSGCRLFGSSKLGSSGFDELSGSLRALMFSQQQRSCRLRSPDEETSMMAGTNALPCRRLPAQAHLSPWLPAQAPLGTGTLDDRPACDCGGMRGPTRSNVIPFPLDMIFAVLGAEERWFDQAKGGIW